jgi:hypothetical protein
VNALLEEVSQLLEALVEQVDSERPLRVVGQLARAYFSGLAEHRAEIQRLHVAANAEIDRLMATLPAVFTGVDMRMLAKMAHRDDFLPDRASWNAFAEEVDVPVPYLVMRVFCLNRRWREAGALMFKLGYCAMLLAECLEELPVSWPESPEPGQQLSCDGAGRAARPR